MRDALRWFVLIGLALPLGARAIGVDRILDLTGFPKENLRFADEFEAERRAFPDLLWSVGIHDAPGPQTFASMRIKAAPITSLSKEAMGHIEKLIAGSNGSAIKRVSLPDGGFGYIGVPAGLGPGGSAVASLIALPKHGIELAITMDFPNDFELTPVPGGEAYCEKMTKGDFLSEFSTSLVKAINEDGPKLEFDAPDRLRYRVPGEVDPKPRNAPPTVHSSASTPERTIQPPVAAPEPPKGPGPEVWAEPKVSDYTLAYLACGLALFIAAIVWFLVWKARR